MLVPRQRRSCPLFAREKGHVKFSNRWSTRTAVATVSHQLKCLFLVLEGLDAHISILWATCIYTVRMRLEFDNQKANVLNLEIILG